ncbi:MAG TPA: serine O-acetyltransferase [Allocoleopsis sp.]
MISTLIADFQIIFERDPAARNWLEVLFCYPGLQALMMYRVAHWLKNTGLPFFPRLLSHIARFLTGIEIHPGATIGQGVFIDHGMGVVIGETAIIGNYALIYQGVTLGGTGKQSGKRHPTLGENVVVGTGAKVLGNINIGDNVRIGAGSVVLRDVPSDSTVVGIPGRIVYRSGVKVSPLEHGSLPDSEAVVIRALLDRIENLEQQMLELQSNNASVNYDMSEKCIPVMVHGNHAGMKRETMQIISDLELAYKGNGQDPFAPYCDLKDKIIEQFLDGTGI